MQGISRTVYQGLRLLESDRYRRQNFEIKFKRYKCQQISYVHGVGDLPLLGEHLGYFVDQSAELYGDRDAVIDFQQNIRRNYVQHKQDIDELATGLLSLKLNKGDRFGIWCPNRYEWIVAQWAAARAGLIMVPLNPAYQASEMDYSIRKVKMRGVLIPESFRTQDYYKLMLAVLPEITDTKPGAKIKSKTHPYFDTIVMLTDKQLPGVFRYKDVIQAGGSNEKRQLEELLMKIQPDDPACIQFTSGTTGSPKAATLSHHNLVNLQTMRKKYKYDERVVRYCLPVPLFHSFGCVGLVIPVLITGQCVILPSIGYNAGDTLKAISKEKCTAICGSPTMFIDILHHPLFAQTDFSSVDSGVIGGAPCPPQLTKTIVEKMGIQEFVVAYGATEISGGVFATYRDDVPDENLRSCGWPYDYVECKIIDENGQIVPMGTTGEICIRGYKVMLGYWENDKATKEGIVKDGWYNTGDLGMLNSNGALSVTGRMKDMILRGGENVYPLEIEDLLITHPKITNAEVVGIPDERLGEQICTWVVLKPNQTMTEEELKEFCKDKIAHYKIPYYVKFVPDLPKTLTGKVKKYAIKEEMIKTLGLKKP